MYCNNCKTNVPDGKFCKFCGREVVRNKKITTKQNGKLISIAVVSTIISCILSLAVVLMCATEENGYSGPTSGVGFIVWFFLWGFGVFPVSVICNVLFIFLNNKNQKKASLWNGILIIFNLAVIIIPTVFFLLLMLY